MAFPEVPFALPDVTLPATVGPPVRLAAIAGPAVLYLYPWTGRPGVPNPPDWDDIPGAHGSTPQADGFRDAHAAYVAAGLMVYGLSGQDTAWQRELSDRLGLPFPLLADVGLTLANQLGAPTFTTGGLRYYTRTTLLVRGGRVLAVVTPVPSPATHAADLLTDDRLRSILREVREAS